MENAFVTLLVDTSAVEQHIISAFKSIKTYSSSIAGTSNISDVSLNNVLAKSKINNSSWYNKIFPEYLNMPSTILSKGGDIDNDLTLLIQLSDQLSKNDSPQIRQSISSYSSSLNSTLQSISSSVKLLGAELITYSKNVAQDANNITAAVSTIHAMQNNLSAEIASLSGKLNSLKRANCPNKNNINAVQAQLNSAKSSSAQYSAYTAEFNSLSVLAHTASTAASYLGNFWIQLNANLLISIKQLQNVMTAPAIIINLNLKENQSNWNQIKSEFQIIDHSVTQ